MASAIPVPTKLHCSSTASQPRSAAPSVEFPEPPELPLPEFTRALTTTNGRIDTKNPDPTQATNPTSQPGIRIPHGRTSASPSVIPVAAMAIVTVLSTSHPPRLNPRPTG